MNFYQDLKRLGVQRTLPSGDDFLDAIETELRTLEWFAERVGFADGVLSDDGPLREQQVDASSLFEPFSMALGRINEMLGDVEGAPRPDAQAEFLREVHHELLGLYTRGFNRGAKAAG